jgi:hypothetical protein
VGSASTNGPPQGLIALIATAVTLLNAFPLYITLIFFFFQLECAARHLYNPKKKLAEFSKDIWGSHVEAYWKSFQPNVELENEGIEPERWEELVKRCQESSESEESDQEMFDADLSFLDDKRPLIFNFRSPSKSRL